MPVTWELGLGLRWNPNPNPNSNPIGRSAVAWRMAEGNYPNPKPSPNPNPSPNPIGRSAVAWRMAEGNYRDDITALVVYLPCLG